MFRNLSEKNTLIVSSVQQQGYKIKINNIELHFL